MPAVVALHEEDDGVVVGGRHPDRVDRSDVAYG